MNAEEDVDVEVPAGEIKLSGYAPNIIVSKNVVVNVPAGELNLKGYAPEVTVSNINEAIELSSDIPPDAKIAAKDFVEEKIQLIIDNFEQLIDLEVPEKIAEYWPIIVDIIKAVLGG